MKKRRNVLFVLICITIAGLFFSSARRRQSDKMLSNISNEGYETAPDILFPEKMSLGKKLHLGPVLPV